MNSANPTAQTSVVEPWYRGGSAGGLGALLSLAVTVLNEHTNDAGLCVACGCAWPCEPAVLAEHNLDVAAS